MLSPRQTGLETAEARGVQADLYGLIIPFLVLACLCLAARMYVRIKAGVYGLEDWCLIAGWVFMFMKAAMIIVMIENGLGMQAEDLQPSNLETIGKALYASVIHYCLGIGLVKLSILIMYRRIFDTRLIRILVNIVGVANAIWVVLLIGLAIFQCIPVQRAWDPTVAGKCLNTKALFVGNAIPHIVIDLIMVAMPIHPVSKLRLPLSQRIALIGIFMLGGIVCIVSMYRVTTLAAIDATNLAFTLRAPAVLGNVEMATAVISASLPTLRPLFSAFMYAVGLSKDNGATDQPSPNKDEGRSRSSTLESFKSKNDGFILIGVDEGPRRASKPLPRLPFPTAKKAGERASVVPLGAIHVRHDVDVEHGDPASQRSPDEAPVAWNGSGRIRAGVR